MASFQVFNDSPYALFAYIISDIAQKGLNPVALHPSNASGIRLLPKLSENL